MSYELYFYTLFALVIASSYFLIIPIVLVSATLLNSLATVAGLPALFEFSFHSFLLSPFNLEFFFGVVAYVLISRYSFTIHPVLLALSVSLFFPGW